MPRRGHEQTLSYMATGRGAVVASRAMNEHAMIRVLRGAPWRRAAGALALALLTPACGGAVASGVAVGKVGQGLTMHAQAAPEGAEVCELKEGLAAQPGAPEKPTSEACLKAQKNDQLWRRSMLVLAAYGGTLETLGSGGNTDDAGKLEAAQTGVHGNDWIEVDGGPEKAAKAAASALVEQMASGAWKGDVNKAVQEAAPHVKAICDGLVPYLEAQAKGFGDAQKEIEKKRIARTDRRCGSLDNRSVCVGDSAGDRVVYANAVASLGALERNHAEARDAAAGFCAAHEKLKAAAADGRLGKSETTAEVIEAVKSARRAQEKGAPAGKAAPPPAKK
jgi:hypothetical protein